ncbi:hypothetical protein KPL88_002554 [Salmonella enterica]|uniref:Type I addiction module toxin, SymE family n=2 Tax=Salmonella enterica TaxID=28901 RepID=A0A5T2XCH0_SALER|nr:hypothetical protein [Salmonella enterica]EBP3657806.1 hypothetical protein [Salmonella enterica subsp. enterica]EDA6661815.1 hypothetical protein [Salmonella enterica subsp. enterica serovar Muenster]EDE1803296.1 hypothetical protein [Salmonella enterica subsp. enterica serovar Enteritidis]EDS5541970.1 hypothetical protein [Salmonella enterica subsp. enterica serovar Uganda]EAA7950534.1 hypothetical protein [Salmonella enterica subsp. enterica serovar Altona]
MNASGASVRHINSETCMTTCYSQIPSGDCQEEAGFETGRSVTVKISDGCIVLMADSNEQLCKAEQVIKGIKDVLVYWISSVK